METARETYMTIPSEEVRFERLDFPFLFFPPSVNLPSTIIPRRENAFFFGERKVFTARVGQVAMYLISFETPDSLARLRESRHATAATLERDRRKMIE